MTNDVPTKLGSRTAVASKVRNGLTWMTVNTLVGRVLTLVSQLVLASFLLPSDFGVWAIALSLSTMAKTLQDMGTRELIVQRDHKSDPRFVSSVAFLGLILNVLSATALVSAGFALADVYGAPELPALCVLVAAQTLILGNWAVNGALLRRDLRFKPVALIEIAGLVTLFAGQVVAAVLDAGVYAFAVPLVLSGVVRTSLGMMVARRRIYRVRPKLSVIRAEIKPLGWLLLGAASFALLQQADYLALGYFMTAGELGVYFFAYQIAAQVGVLISNNLQIVMFPVLSRMLRDGDAISGFAVRMASALLAGSCLMSSVAIFLFSPVETLLYQGKWSGSTTPVIALALAFPLRAIFVLPRSTLLALGRFAASALMTGLMGLGLLGVAIGAGIVDPTATTAAYAISAYLAVTGIAVTTYFAWVVGSTRRAVARGVVSPYLLWFAVTGALMLAFGPDQTSLWRGCSALVADLALTCLLWRTITPSVWHVLAGVVRRRGGRGQLEKSAIGARS